VAVLDASASMSSLIGSVTEGINAFVNEQKKLAGQCFISVYKFDSRPGWVLPEEDEGTSVRIELIRNRVSVQDFAPITIEDYAACGNTPLNDALMHVMGQTGKRLASLPFNQRPGNVVLFISTDGEENSSEEFPVRGNPAVREAIQHQQSKYNWHFIFTGSDVSTYDQADELGTPLSNVLNYVPSDKGVDSLYRAASSKIGQLREGLVSDCSFSAEEKASVESQDDSITITRT
jgi:hypothetical protein